jgi:hypothetical protein
VHRFIFHIDGNSAFVSWLGAKLVREGKPDIRLVHAVIGAGSIVTKDIPADCVAVGNPCKVVKKVK